MSILLSCKHETEFPYSADPRVGDNVFCIRCNDYVWVMPPRVPSSILECEDCTFRKEYPALAKLRVCGAATRHMISKKHRVKHYHPDDPTATLCRHEPAAQPAVVGDRPPF